MTCIKQGYIKICLISILVIIAVLFSGCVEESPDGSSTTALSKEEKEKALMACEKSYAPTACKAVVNNEMGLCEKAENPTNCYYFAAVWGGKPELCKKIKDEQQKQTCYKGASMMTKKEVTLNIKLCETSDNPGYCYERLASEVGKGMLCESTVGPGPIPFLCKAVLTGNASLCSKSMIPTYCKAIVTETPSLCDKTVDPEECYIRVAIQIVTTPGEPIITPPTTLSKKPENFIEQETDYDEISDLSEINGKLTYLAKENREYGGCDTFIVYGGEEVGKEYYRVSDPVEVNGKLAYLAKENSEYGGYDTFIVYGGEEVGKEYFRVVSPPKEINGKLAYIAEEEEYVSEKGRKEFIVYDGERVTEGYYKIGCLKEVGGKLTYLIAQEVNNESKDFVIWGGEKEGGYWDIGCSDIMEIGGKLVYTAVERREGNFVDFIVYGGEEKMYDTIIYPTEVNGKLAYWARNGNTEFIVYDGEIVSEGYTDVHHPTEINGKLTYTAGDIIVYGGKEVGGEYDGVRSPKEINGKLTYLAEEAGPSFKKFIVYGGKKVGGEYDKISSPTEINGKMVYGGVIGNDFFVVYEEKNIGGYDLIGGITEVNGKLVFAAKKNSRWYIVREK